MPLYTSRVIPVQALEGNILLSSAFTLPEVTRRLCGMKKAAHKRPIHAVRWANFRRLIGPDTGAISEAAERLKKLQGQVSHFGGKNPTKPIGDQIAGEIEQAWGLEDGWLDLNHTDKDEGAKLGKTEQQSQPLQLDPVTLREAYLLAVQEAGSEFGTAHKYKLENDPERTVRAYTFLAVGRSASEVAEYMGAAMRRSKQGVSSGKQSRGQDTKRAS
jgi:hypothetical protein